MSKFKIGDTVRFNPERIEEWKQYNKWYSIHGLTDKTIHEYTGKIISFEGNKLVRITRYKHPHLDWLFDVTDLIPAYEFVGPMPSKIIEKIKYLDDKYANRHAHA